MFQISKMSKYRTQRQQPIESKQEHIPETEEEAEYGTLSKVSLLDQHNELKKKAEGNVLTINFCEKHCVVTVVYTTCNSY